MRHCLSIAAGSFAIAILATPAHAADEDKGTVYGWVGSFFTGSDTKIQLDDPSGTLPGTRIDF